MVYRGPHHPPIPELRPEPMPPPRPGYIWRPGHWVWGGADYVWEPGVYVLAQPGWSVWEPGSWTLREGLWVWIGPHWR